MTLKTDSTDYNLINEAIAAIPPHVSGMTCEVGLRRGGGTQIIIDCIAKRKNITHVSIDPYGDIIYGCRDGKNVRYDYTNQMRDETIGEVFAYARSKGVNFVFINLEDTEFFQRYGDGIPVYITEKKTLNEYMFVHIDGPHQNEVVLQEFLWFNERMPSGATMVFDDVNRYDHNKVEQEILKEWNILKRTDRKASYQKK